MPAVAFPILGNDSSPVPTLLNGDLRWLAASWQRWQPLTAGQSFHRT